MLQCNTDASLRKRDRLWSSFGMGISPSIYTHMHILYLYKHRSNRACCKALRLQECTHGAYPHTCTHLHGSVEDGNKGHCVRSMCHYHRSMSRIQVTLSSADFLLQLFQQFFFYRYHFWYQFPNGPFLIFFLIFIFTGWKKKKTWILL